MIRLPTPETISIIITLSWSPSIVRPKWYGPALSHVHEVVMWARLSAGSPSILTNTKTAAANEPIVVTVET